MLPSGTVTFVFTDVEGSTRLLRELGERYAEVLAEHRRILREAFCAYGGVEVDAQGDAFLAAFARAGDALAAAEQAQTGLASTPVRVRVGIHTGEPEVTAEGYVGLDVHRGARICAAAHGGQVVLSQQTMDAAGGLGALVDLGRHRLKDLSEPERLYQFGDAVFPPLRSLNATNLPVQPSPLVGRDAELEELTALIRDGARLVTLTGPGGVGKTRLALQIAAELVEDFPDGVFWVPLAALRAPELVVPTVERAIGAGVPLPEHIDEKEMLLLLDNFEQLLPAAESLGVVLAGCPNLRLLVTSRAGLRVSAEHVRELAPLPESDAVALFAHRARAVKGDFETSDAVGAICDRLDGLPLAIELAAARVRLLTPEALLERLERRLPLLTGGMRDAPERQQTLRATIEWSSELLAENERCLFRSLAVFAGGWSLEAAQQICRADVDVSSPSLPRASSGAGRAAG